jgi:hypothetical protein
MHGIPRRERPSLVLSASNTSEHRERWSMAAFPSGSNARVDSGLPDTNEFVHVHS